MFYIHFLENYNALGNSISIIIICNQYMGLYSIQSFTCSDGAGGSCRRGGGEARTRLQSVSSSILNIENMFKKYLSI